MTNPRSSEARACSTVPVKQCITPPSPVDAPILANQSQHVVPRIFAVVRRPAVNDDRELGRRSPTPSAAETPSAAHRAASDRRSSRARSRPIRRPWDAALVLSARSKSACVASAASWGWMPTVAYTPSYCSASLMAQSNVPVPGPSPLPMASIVVTPAVLRPRKHVRAIAVEALVLRMAVRVGVHGEPGPAYFSRAPLGTSSRKPASTGTPSSPSDAATIMPCDSSPRSLRGARLATITTLRPMSFSGS